MMTLSENEPRILAAISAGELATSAEIKVVTVRYCWGDITEKARRLFRKHGLHKTAERNAVMILLVMANREFLVVGDEGVHEKVGQEFWDNLRNDMQEQFRAGDLVGGVCAAVDVLARQLAIHFPRGDKATNEIPNEVIHET